MSLSLKDTNVLKGVALMMLLWHHLFYSRNGLYAEINIGSIELSETFAKVCKLCVSIFVFLSGYGLTVQAEKNGGINSVWSFYKRRFSKLFVNYWFIWLLFVPMGVLVFGRTFDSVYQTNVIPKLIADFFGLAFTFNYYGYNATWWFMSCIIVLYIFFPFLYKAAKQYPLCTLLCTIAVALIVPPVGGRLGYDGAALVSYLTSFVIGILLCNKNLENDKIKTPSLIVLLPLFLVLWAEHLIVKEPLAFDAVITLSLIMLYGVLKLPAFVTNGLEFLGRHSMNIFLFHTFIFSHWFKDFIYSPKNPFLIFLLLLGVCLIISVLIERLKKVLKIDSLISKLHK